MQRSVSVEVVDDSTTVPVGLVVAGYDITVSEPHPFHVHYTPHSQNNTHCIRESVDSLCKDGADTPMPPYIGKAFTRTNVEDLSLFRYLIMVCE